MSDLSVGRTAVEIDMPSFQSIPCRRCKSSKPIKMKMHGMYNCLSYSLTFRKIKLFQLL